MFSSQSFRALAEKQGYLNRPAKAMVPSWPNERLLQRAAAVASKFTMHACQSEANIMTITRPSFGLRSLYPVVTKTFEQK